jgi:hypothetical protein
MARADLASSNPANPATPLGAILLMSGKKRRLILQAIWGRLAEMRRSSMGSIA